MAFGNYTFTRTLTLFLDRVAMWVGVGRNAIYQPFSVGSPTANTAQTAFVEIVNRVQSDLVCELTALNNTLNTSITLVADQQDYTIPATMHRTWWRDMQFDVDDDALSDTLIKWVSPHTFRALPPQWQNGTVKARIPQFVSMNEDQTKFRFAPTPQESGITINLTMQTTPTQFVIADLSSGSVKFSIPDQFQDLLETLVAFEVALRMGKTEKASELMSFANKRRREVSDAISGLPQRLARAQSGFNSPTQAFLQGTFPYLDNSRSAAL